MNVPKDIAEDVRRRDGSLCRACGLKTGAIVFPLRVPIASADDAVQICAACRQAEKDRCLGMSGHGDGFINCVGTVVGHTGYWRSRVKAK